jgi:kynurenine 3-monooxygenase
MIAQKKDITILGAGLVGSLLAVFLAKKGYKINMYERRPDMRSAKIPAGRSINLALSDRGWKGLRGAGLEDAIRKIAIPMNARMIHNSDNSLSRQPYGKNDQSIYSVSRGEINKALMTLAEQNGIKIYFEHRADDVDLDNKKIKLSYQNKIIETNYDLIIGADGAYSALRMTMQKKDRFDYSQTYIEHGYKELSIPANNDGSWKMEKNNLHIWPRGQFMLIALPNLDGSFTGTLFFPFEANLSFSSLNTDEKIKKFFVDYFPDVIPMMPSYLGDFKNNPVSSLITVRCSPWIYNDSAFLIGDAAHAIVPFFGQGMNCGFEDCTVLNSLLGEYKDDWGKVLPAFERSRKENANAIADLALNNFIEMRDLVTDAKFLRKKQIEKLLVEKYPAHFIPAYTMVTFTEMPYSEALERGQKQNQLLEKLYVINDLEKNWDSPAVHEIIQHFIN